MGTSDHLSQPLALSRRRIIGVGAAALGMMALRPAEAAIQRPRFLSLQNLRTGERVKSEYWAEGGYIPQSLSSIAQVLRDHRNDAVHAIDTKCWIC